MESTGKRENQRKDMVMKQLTQMAIKDAKLRQRNKKMTWRLFQIQKRGKRN